MNNHIIPPAFQVNGHLQTIVPSIFRSVNSILYTRKRIHTPDGDFLDLDWCLSDNNKLVIISHGLEGDSYRGYVRGMAKIFRERGWDVLAWNYRGCSGEVNRKLRFYHSGATDDLEVVIDHALKRGQYTTVSLLGFSLGGNLTLKYLGEKGSQVPSLINRAVVFSVPLDLHGSAIKLSRGINRIYSQRFLRKLKRKVRLKARLFPHVFDLDQLRSISGLIEFDDAITGPIHGFKNAVDYYQQCSSLNFINEIKIPCLIVNARNDPFLSDSCYPDHLLKHHALVSLSFPAKGGHVGFRTTSGIWKYGSERMAWDFLKV